MNSFIDVIRAILTVIQESFNTLTSKPILILALIALIISLFAVISFKNIRLNSTIISSILLALALSTILHFIKLVNLPFGGGSITLGSLVPLLMVSLLYGPEIGMLTGLVFGIIYLIISPYILHPIQILFDYPLAFMSLGIAGFFRKNKILGIVFSMFTKFLFHFISGVVFFSTYSPKGWSPYLYSLLLNGTMVGGELVVTLIIILLIPFKTLFARIKK